MKKIINWLFVPTLLVGVFPALAQENSSLQGIAYRKTYGDNWYVSAGPSTNLLFAEQDGYKSIGSRVQLGGKIDVGKWLNPNFGLSFNVVGGALRGFNLLSAPIETGYYTSSKTGRYEGGHIYASGSMINPGYNLGHPMGGPVNEENGYSLTGSDAGPGFWQRFVFFSPTIDAMFNLTNLFRGYAVEKSRFELVGFVGLGINAALYNKVSNPDFYQMTQRLGLRGNFNVVNDFSVYLEAAAYTTDPEFDGYKGTSIGDLYSIASVGLQYAINRRVSSFERMTIDELDRLNRRVNENRDMIDNHEYILEQQQSLLEKLGDQLSCIQNDKDVMVVREKERCLVLPGYVHFGLDSYTIDISEYNKILAVADFLKDNPASKILLVGYADKKTGSSTYNYGLSKRRVEVVVNELKRLGIDSNRMIVEWKGDKEQLFNENEWNRTVIMVERK
ncbi:MAG: OmpA family protein [Dysgonamonadaceae bacterium]|jgi:outer membrane protein OmpA-like peptidoglycan-associated protein|nr:OmpA family protein [Dysgonamonadaceae bacterium]